MSFTQQPLTSSNSNQPCRILTDSQSETPLLLYQLPGMCIEMWWRTNWCCVTSLVVPQDLVTMMLKYIHTMAQFSLMFELDCELFGCMEYFVYEGLVLLYKTIWIITKDIVECHKLIIHWIILSKIFKVRNLQFLSIKSQQKC